MKELLPTIPQQLSAKGTEALAIDGGAEPYFHPTEMDMVALLREVCQVYREMAPGTQITERYMAVSIPMVGDAKLLYQVLSNILSNAVKYSPHGGAIEVDAQVVAGEVVVAVADHGIGVPAADLDRLFERYHRGSNVSGIVGTGVGLHLVKMAVDLHAGSVAVESREGNGACFTIRLPLEHRPATKASPAIVADAAALDEVSSISAPSDRAPSMSSAVEDKS